MIESDSWTGKLALLIFVQTKKGCLVGLGQRDLCEGGWNRLKYLKRGWNRKEGRGQKGFKKRGGGQVGSRGGCLKKRGWNPLTNYDYIRILVCSICTSRRSATILSFLTQVKDIRITKAVKLLNKLFFLTTMTSELLKCLRIHWSLSTILKTSNKSVWSNVFWYIKVYIFMKFIQYTIHWDETWMLKNFFQQNKHYKKCTLFLSRVPTHHSFTINSHLLYELRHKVHLSKTVCGIFHFLFRLVFIKFIFIFDKKHGLFWL